MLNSRDITLLTKVHIVKTMAFQVVIYGCKCWSINKAESWGIDAFKLWCWRRLLRVPLDYKEIEPVNPKRTQPWIFTGRTDTEAESPVIWTSDEKSWFIGKDLVVGKDWVQEEKQMAEDEIVVGITDSIDMSLSKLQEIVNDMACWIPWGAKSQIWLSNWMTTTKYFLMNLIQKKKKILHHSPKSKLFQEGAWIFQIVLKWLPD